jgi:hypothetical protein
MSPAMIIIPNSQYNKPASDLTELFDTKRCEKIAWKGAGHAEEEVQRGADRDAASSD